ncbi:MAG TPA: pitrilysin family protein [Blastocatellia bacterium]|nr:pitrilysin family protein [Blastocatellia bacterium]
MNFKFQISNFKSVLIAGLFLSVVTVAQTPVPAPTKSTLAPNGAIEGTTEFITSNGLKVIHRLVTGNEVVAARIYFKGGSRNVTEKNAGIETLMWEVAQLGTKNFSKSQINREKDRLGTGISAGSTYDFSVVGSICIRKHFDRTWNLLTDVTLNPVFDEREVALEKDKLISLLRQENDNPETQVESLSDRLLYTAHPYSNRPFGTIENISKLTAADLKAYHATQLTTSRMLVVVVGNVALEELKRKVEASFGKLPRGEYKPGPAPGFKNIEKPEFQVIDKAVPTNYIHGTFPAPSIGDPDYPALMVIKEILQGLFKIEVRDKRNLSYAPGIDLSSQATNSGSISVSTPKPNEAIKVMFEQIELLQRVFVREEYLSSIIVGFLTTYYRNLETNASQAARLAEYELLAGDWRKSGTWLSDVAKVKPEDLNRVANKYLRNFRFAVVGQARDFDRALFLSK